MGPGLASLMTMEQLAEASILYSRISVSTAQVNMISISDVRTVFNNHLQRCIRMPAGGATAGGSQQTGFEMELISSEAASKMFGGWPNHDHSPRRQSWELRSMEELSEHLALEETGWGAMCGKPIAISSGKTAHAGVILIGPPFTVSWMMRSDRSTSLAIRFPLIIWSEEDSMILPPDDAEGEAFYIDPPSQPGFHRDYFKTWARRIAAELVMNGFPMSRAVISHLPKEYRSDSEDDQPITPRSTSPSLPEEDWRDNLSVDSSDQEGARNATMLDSSDEEGAQRAPVLDSSDEEGAHR